MPLKLLLTDSAAEAAAMALELNKANQERRAIEKIILDDAMQEVEASLLPGCSAIVLARRGWHSGVIGIVASHVQRMFNRPTVLVAIDDDGVGRGSARSVDAFDLFAALSVCKDHMVRFGGHSAAAGLTILESSLEGFKKAFEEEAARRLGDVAPIQAIDVDAMVSLSEVDAQLVGALDRLEPFGNMNPVPVFCTHGVTPIPNSFRELKGGHARFHVQQGPKLCEVIAFNMLEAVHQHMGERMIDIAFTARFNTWRNETAVQLILKDIRCP